MEESKQMTKTWLSLILIHLILLNLLKTEYKKNYFDFICYYLYVLMKIVSCLNLLTYFNYSAYEDNITNLIPHGLFSVWL